MRDLEGHTYDEGKLAQNPDPGAWVQGFIQFFGLSPALDPFSTDPAASHKYLFRRANPQRFLTRAQVVDTIVSEGAAAGLTIDRGAAEKAVIDILGEPKAKEPSTSRVTFNLSISAVRTGHSDPKTLKPAGRPDPAGGQVSAAVTWELHREDGSGPELSWTGMATLFPDPDGSSKWQLQSVQTGPQAAWVFSFLKGSLQIGPIVAVLAGLQRGQEKAGDSFKMVPAGQVQAGEQFLYKIGDTNLQIGGQFAAAYTSPSGMPSKFDLQEGLVLAWKF
jgi:hypothetical protein